MPSGLAKCCRIRHIVRLRNMLRRWRNKAASSRTFSSKIPADVPAGHVAVSVGPTCQRFVVRATYLNHPVIKKLLVEAEEEYGFTHHGPLSIPCDESVFEEILRSLTRNDSSNSVSVRLANFEVFKRCGHVGSRNIDQWTESRPILHGFSDKAVW
ncbi:SAUR-like auxin-responsive protein family [Tasmannia lanceolata]|uniref:SAUR-like auxin-responsive protein family n=1 Tax=Tasmannia lanceolata TaxID=3420 RepID=UPI0040628DCF